MPIQHSTFNTQPSAKPPRMFLSPPHMNGDELSLIREAFESNFIAPLGPMVDAFEREFADKVGIPHTLALSCGTAATHLALRLLGVGPGDEVIASTLTFIGSVSPILFQGATPVFVDCDRSTWNLDPNLLEQELEECHARGKLPKAVLPTDLYGQCCDYDKIHHICDRYDIPVVVDAAEALGAYYSGNGTVELPAFSVQRSAVDIHHSSSRLHHSTFNIHNSTLLSARHAGSGAKAAIFSFNGNKIITTSGGGMLASEDAEFIEKARYLSQQARDPAPHYEHTQIGYNYRMSNILAAIGLGQLRMLDERVEKKRAISEYYMEHLSDLPGIEFMPEAPYGRSNRWLTVILVSPHKFGADRETIRIALEAQDIESRPVWKPMHAQPVFRVTGREALGLRREAEEGQSSERDTHMARVVGGAVSEDLFARGLCLPSGTQLTERDLDRVISIIRNCRRRLVTISPQSTPRAQRDYLLPSAAAAGSGGK